MLIASVIMSFHHRKRKTSLCCLQNNQLDMSNKLGFASKIKLLELIAKLLMIWVLPEITIDM